MDNKNKGKDINTDYAIAMGISMRKEDLVTGKRYINEKDMTKEALKEKEEELARSFK
ncbi:hypothetical protein [Clostridium tunisiense]|uniref:hypothetical protein n=1 Tax=Clostridium tunisiense TaxID=219748 RepID=UPI0002EC45F1|nr:hypothetical protein [Clostridium tunisiense]